jgi:hypothetical protein
MRAAIRTAAIRWTLLDAWLQTLVRGMLNVLLVVAAIERLGMGESGVGTLNAAIGAGGFLGALVALSLTGRSAFSSTAAMALALWGLPIAVVGIADPIVAIRMIAIVRLSCSIFTSFVHILQRHPAGRVGTMGPPTTAAAWRPSVACSVGRGGHDRDRGARSSLPSDPDRRHQPTVPTPSEGQSATHAEQARLLSADPLLGLLSLSVVEELAAVLEPVAFADGEYLIREGEAGDRYLIVTAGEVDVSQRGVSMRRLGPGSGIGEISLLRDIPRTASIRAVGPVTAQALDRSAFLSALTGHSPARAAADTIADAHLSRSAPDVPPRAG